MNRAALVVTPHPVSLEGQRVLMAEEAPLLPNETLLHFIGRHGVEPGQQWVVEVDGMEVVEANWARIRPKPGHIIECRRVAQKDALRLVAIIALSYFTMGAGGLGVAGVNGATSTGLFAAGGAIGGGALAAGTAVLQGVYRFQTSTE